jgi:hypothetical protein
MFSPAAVAAVATTPAVVGVLGIARTPVASPYSSSAGGGGAARSSVFTFDRVEDCTDSESEGESESSESESSEAMPPDLVVAQPPAPAMSLTAVAIAAVKERFGDPKATPFPLHRWKEDVGAHVFDWNGHAISPAHGVCLPNPEQVKAARKVAMYAVYGQQLAGWVSSSDEDEEWEEGDYEMDEDEKPPPSPCLLVATSPRDYTGDC